MMKKENYLILEAMEELNKLLELCKENKYSEIEFDLSLARGLEYYTGAVFEVSIKDGPSVAGGGRYDKLIGIYGGQDTPATGISFGVDRLFDYLDDTLIIGPNTDVFIIPLSKEAVSEAFKLGSKIRKQGFGVEVDLMQRNLKKNLDYANKKGIGFVIVLGEKELKSKKFKLKNMSSGKEQEIGFDDINEISRIVRLA